MRLLMIHGRGQGGRDAGEVQTKWEDAFAEGLKAAGVTAPGSLEIDFPYYGDKLDSYVERAKLPTPADVATKGSGPDKGYESFTQSVIAEIEAKQALDEAEVRKHMDPDKPQEKGPQNWEWVQAIVKVIDNHLTPLSGFTIETFLTDVFLYLDKSAVQRAINKIVSEKLTDEPTIVLGHSLGSVVAYRVLMEHADELDLRGFITVGSPLGIKAISSKLGVVDNPAAAVGWYNAYDERDIVALNPLDGTYFPVSPAVQNNDKVKNHTSNRHSIDGYLDDREIAKQIHAALNRQAPGN